MKNLCCICNKARIGVNGSFFKVPEDEERKMKWQRNTKMQFFKNDRVCEDQFVSSDIIRRSRANGLMPNAVPFLTPLQENRLAAEFALKRPCLHAVKFVQPLHVNRMAVKYGTQSDPLDSGHCSMNLDTRSQLDLSLSLEMTVPHKTVGSEEDSIRIKDAGTQTDLQPKAKGKNAGTQTHCMILQKAIDALNAEVKELKAANKHLLSKLASAEAVVDSLKSIFTEGQVKRMMSGGKIQWKWEDISSAICLHASGPRAYNHLYLKGFPLPHVSTLTRWSREINVDEGFLSTSLHFMQLNSELKSEDKLCVLSFDEMKVAETYEYQAIGDYVRKPANYVQVVIARGLKKSWKQPIFYDFDCQMTKEIIYNIIEKLYEAGFTVVAMVCDMGSTNRKLWSELGVSMHKPWFSNPASPDEKVFTFADAPHLLKLVRNHFLDSGLVINNQLITSRTVVDLMKYTAKTDVSITFNLTEDHLSVKASGRQKVKPAAQLFSNTVANAIRRCYTMGLNLWKPMETADFFQLVNDWFDVLNSKVKNFGQPGKEPFGISLDSQKDTLARMNQVMLSPLIPRKRTLEWFQKGIIMTNNAVVMLHEYTKEKYNMSYLVTSRLNQDISEHFFGNTRSKGGLYDHPTPKSFKHRLRKYILARNTENLQGTGNVQIDPSHWLSSCNANSSFREFQNSAREEDVVGAEDELSEEEMVLADEEIEIQDIDNGEFLQDDALEYISGYIIRKQNLEEHLSQDVDFTWVDQLAKPYLKKPSKDFVSLMKKLEFVFHDLNNDKISHKRNMQERLLLKSGAINLPESTKKFFLNVEPIFV